MDGQRIWKTGLNESTEEWKGGKTLAPTDSAGEQGHTH